MTNKPQFVGERNFSKIIDVVACLESGKREKGGALQDGIPSLGGEHLGISGTINWDPEKMKYISQSFYEGLRKGKLKAGDVLVVKDGATTGKVAFVDMLNSSAAINEHVFLLRFDCLDQAKYVYHYLKSPFGQRKILGYFKGSAVGGIDRSFAEMEIPFYQEGDTRIINGQLDAIQAQIVKVNRQVEGFDSLVKSRFVEMFGEVGQTCLLEKLIVPKTHISYGIVQPGPEGTGDMGVLRPVDIVNGRLCLDGIKKIDRRIGDSYRRTELTGSEILTVVRGATGQTVRTEMNCRGMNVTRGIAVIRYDPDLIDPDYLVGYMNSDDGQRYIADHTQGATLQQINIADLKAMPIPVPPLALQQEFAALVARVDKSRFVAQQQIEKLQMLYDSLAQEYFGD